MNLDTQTLETLYREVILTHAVKPMGHGADIEPTHRAVRTNPMCGDEIEVQLRIQGQSVAAAAFTGDACAICLASVSLLCNHLPGQATDRLANNLAGFRAEINQPGSGQCPDFLVPLTGVRAYPARIACATLPWEAALAALES